MATNKEVVISMMRALAKERNLNCDVKWIVRDNITEEQAAELLDDLEIPGSAKQKAKDLLCFSYNRFGGIVFYESTVEDAPITRPRSA